MAILHLILFVFVFVVFYVLFVFREGYDVFHVKVHLGLGASAQGGPNDLGAH